MKIKYNRVPSFNSLPVSTEFNLPQHMLRVDLVATSDTSYVFVDLYENSGVYWFCLDSISKNSFSCTGQINSRGFVGLRDCVSSMRNTLSSLGFSINDPVGLRRFVINFERSLNISRGVA